MLPCNTYTVEEWMCVGNERRRSLYVRLRSHSCCLEHNTWIPLFLCRRTPAAFSAMRYTSCINRKTVVVLKRFIHVLKTQISSDSYQVIYISHCQKIRLSKQIMNLKKYVNISLFTGCHVSKTSFLFQFFFSSKTKAREIALHFWLPVADTAGYKLTIMLCMCVSLFGCQATTVDNVPQRDRGFLCVWRSVCFVLDMLLRDQVPKVSGPKSIRSPLDVVWLTGSQYEL